MSQANTLYTPSDFNNQAIELEPLLDLIKGQEELLGLFSFKESLSIHRKIRILTGADYDFMLDSGPNQFNDYILDVRDLKPSEAIAQVRNAIISEINKLGSGYEVAMDLKTDKRLAKLGFAIDVLLFNFSRAYSQVTKYVWVPRKNPKEGEPKGDVVANKIEYLSLVKGNDAKMYQQINPHYGMKLSRRTFNRLTIFLMNTGIIEFYPGWPRKVKPNLTSKIIAGNWLRDRMWEAGLYVAPPSKPKHNSLVSVRKNKTELWCPINDPAYPVLKRMNSLLADTQIDVAIDGHETFTEIYFEYTEGKPELYRIYTPKLGEHGRIYHGYSSFKSDHRHRITFNGEPTVELDYGASQLHVCYSMKGVNYWDLHDHDPYVLPNYSEKDRKILKQLFNNSENGMGGAYNASNLNKKAEDGIPIDRAIQMLRDLKAYHCTISDRLDGKHGPAIAYQESLITVEVLRLLGDRSIPVLPIHDSFIVAAKHKVRLKWAMRKAYKNLHYCSIPSIN